MVLSWFSLIYHSLDGAHWAEASQVHPPSGSLWWRHHGHSGYTTETIQGLCNTYPLNIGSFVYISTPCQHCHIITEGSIEKSPSIWLRIENIELSCATRWHPKRYILSKVDLDIRMMFVRALLTVIGEINRAFTGECGPTVVTFHADFYGESVSTSMMCVICFYPMTSVEISGESGCWEMPQSFIERFSHPVMVSCTLYT